MLTADEQYYIPNETIYIKDDVTLGADTVIGTLTTNENGRFSGTWTATPRSDGGAYDFFAVFEGTSSYGYARSQEYSVTVIETATTAPQFYGTKIILDPLPTNVNKGDPITFSGILLTADEQYYIPNETIYIKDDVTLGADTVIGTLTTNENGRFSGTWTATPRSDGGAYDFFAVFEGTSSYGYARSQEYAVSVIGPTESTTPTYGLSGKYHTELVLNQIPVAVYSTQSVTFSGQLTSNGQPVANALIYIKEDDPLLPDQLIANGKTNSNGVFSISWRVTPGLVEIDFDIYAVFEGDDLYIRAITTTQQMKVEKYWSEVTLHSFPQTVNFGEEVIFSGTVKLEKGSPEGFVVYIKDEDPLNADDLMATAYVQSDGSFRANWSATNVDADGVADVYAVLEATELYYRSTTCAPSGITYDFGGECTNVFSLRVTGIPTEQPEIIYEEPTRTYDFSGDEYMKLYYALQFSKPPVIAIVADPDAYDEVKPYLIPIQEGVLIWNDKLEKNYSDGNWDLDFDIITPGKTFPRMPDIIINAVYNDEICNDFGGVAWTSGIKPLNSKVCTNTPATGNMKSQSGAASIAGHEFAHTVGSGHAFNKPGDRMCSVDWNTRQPTCPVAGISDILKSIRYSGSGPSDFDLAAIIALYGTDGWKNPNNISIVRDTKLTAEEFLSGQIDKGMDSNTEIKKDKNIITSFNAYISSDFAKINPVYFVDVFGSLTACPENFPDSVSIKIFNPSGKLVTSDKLSFQPGGCAWLEKDIAINSSELISGEWRAVAEYFGVQKEVSFDCDYSFCVAVPTTIPSWIKNNAGWWSAGLIGDSDFVKGIEYMVNEGIIKIGNTQSGSGSSQKIPDWVKNNAKWWSDGLISDDDFVKGIEYMVKEGIIKVS